MGTPIIEASFPAVHAATTAGAASSSAGSSGAAGGAAAAASLGLFIPKSVLFELLTSGCSVGLANTCTNPLDVIKVRLQMTQNQFGVIANSFGTVTNSLETGVAPKRLGMVSTGLAVVRSEGVLALWSGLGPSLARGFFFGGARLGLYTPIKAAISGDVAKPSLELKILSGSLSGGLAAAVTSPIELIKTRLQAAGKRKKNGVSSTSMSVIRSVMARDGVVGLWKGAMPGLVRSAILTAAQCATYDEVKRHVMDATGWKDTHIQTHLGSSMVAGLVTTTITNPIDVIKTRMFLGGGAGGGIFACASNVMRKDGPLGFMKGWSASYARLGPHTCIMFLAAEYLRKHAGLKSL